METAAAAASPSAKKDKMAIQTGGEEERAAKDICITIHRRTNRNICVCKDSLCIDNEIREQKIAHSCIINAEIAKLYISPCPEECVECEKDRLREVYESQWTEYGDCLLCNHLSSFELPKRCGCNWYVDIDAKMKCKECDAILAKGRLFDASVEDYFLPGQYIPCRCWSDYSSDDDDGNDDDESSCKQ